jgi:hypothetical protein
MAEEPELTPEELEQLEALGLGYPKNQDKPGLYAFFDKILKTEDTTKVGNLDKEELASVRYLRDAALFCNVFELDEVEKYLKAKSEITLASSDSKFGFLINTAVTQKKQVDSGHRAKAGGNGWFKKKEQTQETD